MELKERGGCAMMVVEAEAELNPFNGIERDIPIAIRCEEASHS
jgi:hypothetical protein